MPKAAIIGGGVIGGGWAARFLLNGWDVAVADPDPQAQARLEAVLANARRTLPMLHDTALPPEGRLALTSLEEAVAGAEWVQESVPERLDLKHAVYDRILAAAPRATIGSSTSGFRPSELDRGAACVFVAHPFNPVYLLPLVELVAPEGLDPAPAAETLRGLGMFPLTLRREIDAHVADRLMEAVWREALWLVKDGVATTGEIDEAIRMGFGLRWAQMGLFETFRLAGGAAGMRHFLHQFGPALHWPWTRLTDVPELDEALIETIAGQSDAQSAGRTVAELETVRDDALVALLRALKARDHAAGRHLNAVDAAGATLPGRIPGQPIRTLARTVPVDWTDYNGHMNEGRYGQVFSDASETVLDMVGAGPRSRAAGGTGSFFTVETTIGYRAETHAAAPFHVDTTVLLAEGRKLRLRHEMHGPSGLHATCDQLMIHVDMTTRRSALPPAEVAAAMAALARDHPAPA